MRNVAGTKKNGDKSPTKIYVSQWLDCSILSPAKSLCYGVHLWCQCDV